MLKRIESLYDKFGGKLYRYLCLKMKSANDAEDVLQEVFCRLMQYPLSWNYLRSPTAYIFRIARNEALRRLEKNARYQQGCRARGVHEVIDCMITVPNMTERIKLAAAMDKLQDNQLEIIYLRFFEGLTFREIAAACGVSINTAASRCRYGLEKLRRIMEEGI